MKNYFRVNGKIPYYHNTQTGETVNLIFEPEENILKVKFEVDGYKIIETKVLDLNSEVSNEKILQEIFEIQKFLHGSPFSKNPEEKKI